MGKSFALTRGRVWFAMVASFAAYGFLGPGLRNQIHGAPFDWKYALAVTVSYMAIGICVATCLVIGMSVCNEVRLQDTERRQAIFMLAASSIASAVVPNLILICMALFQRQVPGLIFSEVLLTAAISLLSFITFAAFVFSVAKR